MQFGRKTTHGIGANISLVEFEFHIIKQADSARTLCVNLNRKSVPDCIFEFNVKIVHLKSQITDIELHEASA